MKIRVLTSASRDITDNFQFYEDQEVELGIHFLRAINAAIDSLQVTAGIHSVHFEHFHRLLADKFPFSILYRVIDDEVVVFAVYHNRADADRIREELDSIQ